MNHHQVLGWGYQSGLGQTTKQIKTQDLYIEDKIY